MQDVSNPSEEKPRASTRRVRRRWVVLSALLAALLLVGGVGVAEGPRLLALMGVNSAASSDSDGDGLTDDVETAGWITLEGDRFRSDPELADSDGDGLTDSEEAGVPLPNAQPRHAMKPTAELVFSGFSNPNSADSDGDGLPDVAEADASLNAFARDTDGDGLDDARELNEIGSAADLPDTDGDGFDDGFEVANVENSGLDPLVPDTKVSAKEYAQDYAIGLVAGDAWPKDSVAWLAGSLSSSGSSVIPVVGEFVGPVADIRDAVGSAIHGDWVSASLSAASLVPYAGDAVAIPAKALRFVVRKPEMAATVAKLVSAYKWAPDFIKARTGKKIFTSWDELRAAGAGQSGLVTLMKGSVDLNALGAAMKRQSHVPGASTPLFKSGSDGEAWLEGALGAQQKGVSAQVRQATGGCVEVCNPGRVRIVDVLQDGIAHESKVGRVQLSPTIERQINSDAYLIRTGAIQGAHWHFFPSEGSHSLGASPSVLDRLDSVGIPYTIHLPA